MRRQGWTLSSPRRDAGLTAGGWALSHCQANTDRPAPDIINCINKFTLVVSQTDRQVDHEVSGVKGEKTACIWFILLITNKPAVKAATH